MAECEQRFAGQDRAGFSVEIATTDARTHAQALAGLASLALASKVANPGGWLRAILAKPFTDAPITRWREQRQEAAQQAAQRAERERRAALRAEADKRLHAGVRPRRQVEPPKPEREVELPACVGDVLARIEASIDADKAAQETARAQRAASLQEHAPPPPQRIPKPSSAACPVPDARRLRALLEQLALMPAEHRQRPAMEAQARALYDRGVKPEPKESPPCSETLSKSGP